MAEIRAIEKVGLAEEVRKQKLEEAQAISEAVLGPNHPDTRITYSTIAGIYSAMGNEKKALEYFLKSIGLPG